MSDPTPFQDLVCRIRGGDEQAAAGLAFTAIGGLHDEPIACKAQLIDGGSARSFGGGLDGRLLGSRFLRCGA